MSLPFDETKLRAALRAAWSLETARQWTAQTPAAGQCNVTAVAAHDLYGGDICLTPLEGYDVPHFYNLFAGQRVDLTDSQFDTPIRYANTPATRDYAMRWVTADELATLRDALETALRN